MDAGAQPRAGATAPASDGEDAGPSTSPRDAGGSRKVDAAMPVMPTAGTSAPVNPDSKQALVDALTERADKNPPNEILIRTSVAQLDTPLPPNAATVTTLLTLAASSFNCAQDDKAVCELVCEYAASGCLACLAERQCAAELVLVCGNPLLTCL
jgi:hypothetical protein